MPHHKYGIYSISHKSARDKESQTVASAGQSSSVINSSGCASPETEVGAANGSASTEGLIGKQQQIIGESSKIKERRTRRKEETSKFQDVAPSPKWLLNYLENCKGSPMKPPANDSYTASLLTEGADGACAGGGGGNFETQGDLLLAVKALRLCSDSRDVRRSSVDRKIQKTLK